MIYLKTNENKKYILLYLNHKSDKLYIAMGLIGKIIRVDVPKLICIGINNVYVLKRIHILFIKYIYISHHHPTPLVQNARLKVALFNNWSIQSKSQDLALKNNIFFISDGHIERKTIHI